MTETRTITVRCTWRSTHAVDVPADFPPGTPATLDAFPLDVLEQLTSDVAELVDWEVS